MTSAPDLETPRLLLRPHRLDDYPQSVALWSDPHVTRFIGGSPRTPEDTWNRLLRYAGHWALLGYGYWVVEEKSSGLFIGEAGFADYRREIHPPIVVPEAGWALCAAAHGKGYATEAVQAMHLWASSRFTTGTACLIHPENTASLRVAAKCGYREQLRTTFQSKPTIIFTRPR